MTIIKNRDSLLSHGNVAARKIVLDILETGLAAADPYPAVLEILRIEGTKLIVGCEEHNHVPMTGTTLLDRPRPVHNAPLVFDLDEINNIYVVGGGKAAQRQAEAIEEVLGDRITEGHVNAKKGDTIRLKRIGVTLAGHPIPDAESVSGAHKILEIEHKAQKGDIVFMSESGGGSALMTCPAPGLTLQDLQDVNRIMYFEHGAPMPETNAVRGLLSVLRLKHSRHVGDATLIQFSTAERPPAARPDGRMLSPRDKDDFCHAIDLLHEFECWDEIPESVRQHLLRADPQHQILKGEEWWDKPHYNFRVMGPEFMLDAAVRRARTLGLDAHILISSLASLEARTIGETSSFLAREIADYGRPCTPPCVYLIGGELVVTTGPDHGLGGRNQEFVLASALHIGGCENVVIASADSDGRDGPSMNAGGIVDGHTLARADGLGIDVADALLRHDTDPALEALGDAIHTGVLHTNVQDLRVICVGEPSLI